MGFYRGPSIVRDGLVLYLDAANQKSYPGSGTTWNDLSGNKNNGTLVNGPTFSSGNNGSIVFDGVNDYMQVNSHEFRTIDIWIKYQNIGTGWKYLLDARPGAPSGWYAPPGIGSNWSFQAVNGIFTTVSFSNIPISSWCNLVLISNQNYTSTINFMSRFSNNEVAAGEITQIRTYNRALTADEIQQNYNATKSRFGL